MDGQFDHNDFEHFVKENADAHRLYPADRVWTNIYSRLHSRRRRTLALLLLLPLITGAGFLWWQALEQANRADHQVHNATTTTSITSPLATVTQVQPSIIRLPEATVTADEIMPVTPPEPIEITPVTAAPPETGALPVPEAPPTAIAATTHRSPAEISQEKVQQNEEKYPLSIESVVNSYQRQLHRPRFRWQLHFTPTISYRTLQEDQKFIAQARFSSSAAPSPNTNTTDLASVIRHRPDIGMQLGVTGTYPISKRVDWITGIQFNVSKYDIEAYNYPSEVATIALMNPWGGTRTVSTLTSFRSNGFRSTANWLRNYYYSVSLPIGLQWRVLGKKHTQWGISATVQPTYVVGNRSYVISADYQNYAEVPYLINKWNLNVGFETFARFQLGKNDFQIGPQIRYQALSSFTKGYPVQEHLYDFGIKLGMILGK